VAPALTPASRMAPVRMARKRVLEAEDVNGIATSVGAER
jgi:hypothetical protein